MSLNLDPDELASCVQCGLCLPHCPTFRVSGDESMSPRGRIALMRSVEAGAPVTDEVKRSFETCVQCRGCETACPSGVKFGHLMEKTREALANAHEITPSWQRFALGALEHPRVLSAGTKALAVAQRVHIVPKRLGLPHLPLRSAAMESSGGSEVGDVYLFTGCVMDVWQRDVHRDVQYVLEQAGYGVIPTTNASCCGALHTHAGLGDRSRKMARHVMETLDEEIPILVDSAGCGAAMKEYGSLLGTEEAVHFANRVFDVSEWLVINPGSLVAGRPLDLRVAVQDPCHLRHVQRVHLATRELLRPFVRELIELDDEGLCCGAGGSYSALEPDLAGQIRDRKVASITRAQPDVVVSANPGCSMHLQAVGVKSVHPLSLVAQALRA
jgi:glycolate oxidase iron-sulfur subunit